MLISEVVQPELIYLEIKSKNKEELFDEITEFLASKISKIDCESIKRTLWAREKMLTTGIMPNIALPHTQVKDLDKTIGMVGISREGIEYGSLDNRPVHIIMLFIDNENDTLTHLEIIRNAAMLATNPMFFPQMMKARSPVEAHETIRYFEELYFC